MNNMDDKNVEAIVIAGKKYVKEPDVNYLPSREELMERVSNLRGELYPQYINDNRRISIPTISVPTMKQD